MENGAVSQISYYQIYREVCEHIEMIITPKQNDRRQNTNTMPGREGERWKKLYRPKIVKAIQTLYQNKYDTDIEPITKEETMTRTEWNTKEEKVQEDSLWENGPEATHQTTRTKYQTEPNRTKLKSTNQSNYKPDTICRKETNITHEKNFLGETNRHGNTGRPLGEIDWTGKRLRFSRI